MSGERRDCVSARVERARDRERLGERERERLRDLGLGERERERLRDCKCARASTGVERREAERPREHLGALREGLRERERERLADWGRGGGGGGGRGRRRRSGGMLAGAAAAVAGALLATAGDGAPSAGSRSWMACHKRLRSPTAVTPIASRSPSVSDGRMSSAM
jgi:hypothetical protein